MKTFIAILVCFMAVSVQARPLTAEETKAQSEILNLGERKMTYAVLGDHLSIKLAQPVSVTKIERKLWEGALGFVAQITLVHDNGSAAKCTMVTRNDENATVITIARCSGFMTGKTARLELGF